MKKPSRQAQYQKSKPLPEFETTLTNSQTSLKRTAPYLDASFAFGVRQSVATEIPDVEEERRGDGQTQEELAYHTLELEEVSF